MAFSVFQFFVDIKLDYLALWTSFNLSLRFFYGSSRFHHVSTFWCLIFHSLSIVAKFIAGLNLELIPLKVGWKLKLFARAAIATVFGIMVYTVIVHDLHTLIVHVVLLGLFVSSARTLYPEIVDEKMKMTLRVVQVVLLFNMEGEERTD